MKENPLNLLNDSLRQEASMLLKEKGLLQILEKHGTPHISGSYSLGLMCWRDLDIYLETDGFTEDQHFQMGGEIALALRPHKMNYRNEKLAQTAGLPDGLYWGVYAGEKEVWKIDLWVVSPMECRRLLNFCEAIRKQLNPARSLQILEIKSQCWQDPEYRKTFSSGDIYNAVLNENAGSIVEFKEYLQHLKK